MALMSVFELATWHRNWTSFWIPQQLGASNLCPAAAVGHFLPNMRGILLCDDRYCKHHARESLVSRMAPKLAQSQRSLIGEMLRSKSLKVHEIAGVAECKTLVLNISPLQDMHCLIIPFDNTISLVQIYSMSQQARKNLLQQLAAR